MSELQIGVLILGGSVIGLVYGFNMLQEWRFRKRTRQAFIPPQSDVLLTVPKNNVRDGVKQDRLEPVLLDIAIPVLEQEDERYGVISPVASDPSNMTAQYDEVLERPLGHKTLSPSEIAGPSQPYQSEVLSPVAQLSQFDTLASFAASLEQQNSDHSGPAYEERVAAASAYPQASLDNIERQALVTALLDPTLDFIAEINCATVVELATLPQFKATKRVQIIGRTEHGDWLCADPLPVRYKQINIALQLVDRSGAVAEQELASFCQQVTRFAEAHHAAVSFPLRQQKLVAARELDCFCAEVDVLIGINIVAAQPIHGSHLRRYAQKAHLQLESDGAFHYLADSGNTLYSLVAENQVPFTGDSLETASFPALTLLFDVPRVAGGVKAFERALAFARELAEVFDAQLVDDNHRALTDHGLSKISDRLHAIYRSMDARGIAPGSVAALRLFA